jgi:DNA-binding GntR family transcriptional regulator
MVMKREVKKPSQSESAESVQAHARLNYRFNQTFFHKSGNEIIFYRADLVYRK